MWPRGGFKRFDRHLGRSGWGLAMKQSWPGRKAKWERSYCNHYEFGTVWVGLNMGFHHPYLPLNMAKFDEFWRFSIKCSPHFHIFGPSTTSSEGQREGQLQVLNRQRRAPRSFSHQRCLGQVISPTNGTSGMEILWDLLWAIFGISTSIWVLGMYEEYTLQTALVKDDDNPIN